MRLAGLDHQPDLFRIEAAEPEGRVARLGPGVALEALGQVSEVGLGCEAGPEADRRGDRVDRLEALALGQQLALLIGQKLAVPGEVRGALAMPARRIGVGTDRARGTGAADRPGARPASCCRWSNDPVRIWLLRPALSHTRHHRLRVPLLRR